MQVRILGPVAVEHAGRSLRIGGGRIRALLARLALDPGRPVTADRLVDAVWDEELPADPGHALHSLVSRLRGQLEDAGLVTATPGGYRLAISSADVDAGRFEQLAADGHRALRAGEPERAVAVLGEALGLWRGPALADVDDYRFAVAAAASLEDRRIAATVDRVEAELAVGGGERLVAELEELVAANPLHERLAGQLIAALSAAGRQAEALGVYERVRKRLADELGASPGAELQAAHLAVLQGRSTPAPVSRDRDGGAGPRARSNLSASVTSFVGRELDIERVDRLLDDGRLVTLVGPGGAGKTRLAREVAAGWVRRVADGVWMVELAPVTEPVEVVPAILGALGLRELALLERPGRPVSRDGLERLLDLLADREAILVLDNCEQLVGPVAELVDRLLGACPGLRILATSREPLAIAGENLATVAPLGLAVPGASAEEAVAHPAVQLFADRAGAASPDFAVDESTVNAVVEICRRLDGLPLAIELAAARLRSLPVEEIAARLDDRFALLTGGSRTALPRHRTLRAVVDWSWDLLSESERRLARRLAVFSAGSTLAGAQAVCGDRGAGGTEVLDGLAALVDRSLVALVPGASPARYRMLETIREYGLERLAEAGEAQAVRAAHARWFAALVEDSEPQLRRAGQAEALARFEEERENILAALRWFGDSGDARAALSMALRLLWFWLLTGSNEEARGWIEFALAVPGEADPTDRTLAESIAFVSADPGDGDPTGGVRDRLRTVAARLDPIDDSERPLLAVAKPVLAMVGRDLELIDRRMSEAARHPDPWVRASTSLFRAAHFENEGDLEMMQTEADAALDGYRQIGDSWGAAMVLTLESGRRMFGGDLEGAEAAVAEGRRCVERLTATAGNWPLDVRPAEISLRRNDFAAARAHALRATDRGDLASDDRVFVQALVARISWLAGDLEAARREAAEADERLARMGRMLSERGHATATLRSLQALIDLAGGDVERAGQRLNDAYRAGLLAEDMPIMASVGLAAAAVAGARDRARDGAEILGATVALRGAEDPANPEVVRLRTSLCEALGDAVFATAYERGRAMTRAEAIARLDPGVLAASGPPPVGP